MTTAKPKKLFVKEWLEIVALAEGGSSVERIADEYGVHKSVIYRGLKKRKVNIGAAAARAEAEENAKMIATLREQIRETKTRDYASITFHTHQLTLLTAQAVKEGGGLAFGKYLDSAKMIKLQVDSLEKANAMKYRLLGLDRENKDADAILPELPITEMTELETENMRNQQELEDGMAPGELEDMVLNRAADDDDEVDDIVDEDDESA